MSTIVYPGGRVAEIKTCFLLNLSVESIDPWTGSKLGCLGPQAIMLPTEPTLLAILNLLAFTLRKNLKIKTGKFSAIVNFTWTF